MIQTIPDDHFFSINNDQKQIVFHSLASSQQMYSFTNICLKDSVNEFFNEELTSFVIDDLHQGYSNALFFISDDAKPYDTLVRLVHNILDILYAKTNIDANLLIGDIAISAFSISSNLCYDLISKSNIDIKELEDTKEVLIEGLSYQIIKTTIEGDCFINNIIDNFNNSNANRDEISTLFFKIAFIFHQFNINTKVFNTYISKLDLITIPFNKQSLIQSKEIMSNNSITINKEDQLTTLFNSINYPIGKNSFDSSTSLSLLFREYIGSKTKTKIIMSLNNIMDLTKEESNAVFSFLSNAMAFKSCPIPKGDSISNYLLYKSIYHQLTINNNPYLVCTKEESADSSNQLVSHIKELFIYQNNITNVLKRFPCISIETVISVNKYKEECESLYGTNCSEISRLKLLLEETLNESNNFNQNIIIQKESNGKADIDYIKVIQLFSERIDHIIHLLKIPIPIPVQDNTDRNQMKLEREAYLSILNYYLLKDSNALSSSKEENSEQLLNLIRRLIDINEEINKHLLKGKVIDSYEIINKSEYYNLIKQINESKYNGLQKVDLKEESTGDNTIKELKKEIEGLNDKINKMMKDSSIHQNSFNNLFICDKQIKIQLKGKTKDNNQMMNDTIALSPILLSSPKLNPSIKVKTKNNKWYHKTNRNVSNKIFIAKADSFTFFKHKTRNLLTAKPRLSTINQRLKIKQQHQIEYIIIQKDSTEFLRKQLEEKVNQIKHLKLFNEYTTKQKELEMGSYTSQLISNKQKIQYLEEEIKELNLTKDYLMRENAGLKAEKKQLNTITLSPNRQSMNLIGQSYIGLKNTRPVSLINKQNQNEMAKKINKSLEIKKIKEYNSESRIKAKKEVGKNESCELTGNSREIAEGNQTPRIMVNKIIGNQGLNDSAIRLLEEIKEDNGLLLNELSVLKSKNYEIASDLKKLTQGQGKNHNNEGSLTKKKKNYSTYTEVSKKIY